MRSSFHIENLWHDIRYAVRQLRQQPGFTAVAIATLTLGIGASTAIFSVVNAVLLRPLPYPEPERLMVVDRTSFKRGGVAVPFSPPDYVDFHEQTRTLLHFGVGYSRSAILTGGEPERLDAASATAGFLAALGVRPKFGRLFSPEDERNGAPPIVLVGHALWQRRFNSDPGLIGRVLTVDDQPRTVVGILPAGIKYPLEGDIWLPVQFEPGEMQERSSRYLHGLARLAPGVTPAQAQSELDTIAQRLAQLYPESDKNFGATAVPLLENVVGDIRPTLFYLLGAVGFVWLIACANIANLMLSRAASREREMAVRAALGAARARLAAQLLTESTLVALVGGAAGFALGRWCLAALVILRPANLPRLDEVSFDARVFAFAAAISALAGLLFGLAPALRASRPDWGLSLKAGAQTTAVAYTRMRAALVVAQISLSLVLLAGAGLMLRTMWTLLSTPPGFDPKNVLVADIFLSPLKYADDSKRAAFLDAVLERLRALPGVESAGSTTNLPLAGGSMVFAFVMDGQPQGHGQTASANFRAVSPRYHSLMRIPLRRGRYLDDRDRPGSSDVAVINEAMARQFWPGEDPIGRRIRIARQGEPAWREIVGIVGNIRHGGLHQEPSPEMYVPYTQQAWRFLRLAVRTTGDPAALAPALRKSVWAVDRDQPVSRVRTMDDVVAASMGETRFYSLLLGIFAMLALGLASVGIYGVMSYAVAARTREIGIRLALGAQRQSIFRLVLARGARLTALGIVLGLTGALAATRGIEKLLYGVQPTDALTFASVATVLAVVALLACWLPARRATRVDPAITLRYE